MLTQAAPRTRLTLPVALAAGTVLLQIGYPLLHGHRRDQLTVITVGAFLACTVGHLLASLGPRWTARYLAITLLGALVVEAVGVRTGFPFGTYTYSGSLGWRILGVPLVVPMAWAMFAWPALLVGRLIGRPVVAGAWALASWDLFLDPQMVAAGHWHWTQVRVPLPGGTPLSNLVGWLLVSLLLMTVLQRLPEHEGGDVRAPIGLFLWTWVGSFVANAVFFDRPAVAITGLVGMGLVGIPLLTRLR